ncbi:MAG: LEA type 2 family protein [Prevotellaceae bacterium]|nr:LEA type 2 family protein [Prevotellaceae bacterium]
MKIIIRIGFFLLMMVAAGACTTDFSKVRFDDFRVDSLHVASLSKIYISASLKITNPTKQVIRLRAADFDVSVDGAVFAHLRLREEVLAPAKSSDFLSVPLELQITDWLAVLGIGKINADEMEEQLEKFILNGHLHVKAGVWNRTLWVQNRTLKQLAGGGE